jgi:hypothetical protein
MRWLQAKRRKEVMKKIVLLSVYDDGYEAECSILRIDENVKMEKKKVLIEVKGCVREATKDELYLASMGLQDIEEGMTLPPLGLGIDELMRMMSVEKEWKECDFIVNVDGKSTFVESRKVMEFARTWKEKKK